MTATQVLEASIRRISNLRDGMIVASRSTTDRLFESPSAANYSTRTRSRSASALGWASVLSSEEEWTQVTGPKPAPAVVAAAFFDHVR